MGCARLCSRLDGVCEVVQQTRWGVRVSTRPIDGEACVCLGVAMIFCITQANGYVIVPSTDGKTDLQICTVSLLTCDARTVSPTR